MKNSAIMGRVATVVTIIALVLLGIYSCPRLEKQAKRERQERKEKIETAYENGTAINVHFKKNTVSIEGTHTEDFVLAVSVKRPDGSPDFFTSDYGIGGHFFSKNKKVAVTLRHLHGFFYRIDIAMPDPDDGGRLKPVFRHKYSIDGQLYDVQSF
ncbi:MAG: hypothetical protein H8D63_02970 [Parcubacteria group bacterium]|nr:hypothetical protein [Parcubacteria group bacterium]